MFDGIVGDWDRRPASQESGAARRAAIITAVWMTACFNAVLVACVVFLGALGWLDGPAIASPAGPGWPAVCWSWCFPMQPEAHTRSSALEDVDCSGERATDACSVRQALSTAGPFGAGSQFDLFVRLSRQSTGARTNRPAAGGNKPWSRWLLPLLPWRP